jgi:hypothetical protein
MFRGPVTTAIAVFLTHFLAVVSSGVLRYVFGTSAETPALLSFVPPWVLIAAPAFLLSVTIVATILSILSKLSNDSYIFVSVDEDLHRGLRVGWGLGAVTVLAFSLGTMLSLIANTQSPETTIESWLIVSHVFYVSVFGFVSVNAFWAGHLNPVLEVVAVREGGGTETTHEEVPA